MFYYVFKEIMFQGFRNFHKRFNINTLSIEDFINVGSLAMYSSRKLRHAQPAIVENGFHHVPDVKFALSFHNIAISQHNIKKAWK